jgi:hypothetical protein
MWLNFLVDDRQCGNMTKLEKKNHCTRPTLVCPMVLGDIFLAQNNSGKLTIRSSVFLFFQFCDIKNLIWLMLPKNSDISPMYTGKKRILQKFPNSFCLQTTKSVRNKNTPYKVCSM